MIDTFYQIELHIGTIIDATFNLKAKKPAYHLTIDFGPLGIKSSSAQITNYNIEELIGRQVVAVTNLDPIMVADVKSEVLVLGVDSKEGITLLSLEKPVENGAKVY